MENEKLIYRLIVFLGAIVVLTLLLLVEPKGIFNEAIDFFLVIGALAVEIRAAVQLRRIKKKEKQNN